MKIFKFLMAMCLAISVTCVGFISDASAASQEGLIRNKLEVLGNQAGYGWQQGSTYSGSGECKGFADKVYYEVFGVKMPALTYSDNNYWWSGGYLKTSKLVSICEGGQITNVEGIKKAFAVAKPGYFLQMAWRDKKAKSNKNLGAPHSAIIVQVNPNTVTLYEANWVGKNKISWQERSYSEFIKMRGFAIYAPNNYRLK